MGMCEGNPKRHALGFMLLTLMVLAISAGTSLSIPGTNLSGDEGLVTSLVDLDLVWETGVLLEETSWEHPASRLVGTTGNSHARDWLVEELRNMGLEAWVESVRIPEDWTKYTWNITAEPVVALDLDGRLETTTDRVELGTARVNYGSLGTNGTKISPLVICPLPPSCRPEAGTTLQEEDQELLASIDSLDKAVVFPVELPRNWTTGCLEFLMDRLEEAIPAVSIAGPYSEETYPGYWGWSGPYPQICVEYEDVQRILSADGVNVSVLLSLSTEAGGCDQAHNIVARIHDDAPSGPRVIVGAHYDTVQTPGFVDNGLGVAAALEIGRIFARARGLGVQLPFDLDIVLFDGEERGLLGSGGYVEMHRSELDDLLAVIVFDCIGLEYEKYHLSQKGGGSLSPYARFPVLRSGEDELLEWGLDINPIIGLAASDLGQTPIPIEPDKAWRSDHSSFAYHLPAMCFSSGILPIAESQHATDMPWVHSLYMDSYDTSDWADRQGTGNQIGLAALTVMRIGDSVTDGHTPEEILHEIQDDVQQLADGSLRSALAQQLEMVSSAFAQQDYLEGVKRAEIVSCLSHLQRCLDEHPRDSVSPIIQTIIDAGISSLAADISSWYQKAVYLRSDQTMLVADRIADASELLEETRAIMTESDVAAAERYLDISRMSLENANHDKAMEYVQRSEDKIRACIHQELLLPALGTAILIFNCLNRGTAHRQGIPEERAPLAPESLA